MSYATYNRSLLEIDISYKKIRYVFTPSNTSDTSLTRTNDQPLSMSKTIASRIANIDIITLVIFIKVYETKSIGKAAALVNSNSPKVSRAISLLRSSLGDELFYRRKSGLVPTPAADRIYSEITPAINIINSSAIGAKK